MLNTYIWRKLDLRFKELCLPSSNLIEFSTGSDVNIPFCNHVKSDELYKMWISFGVTLYSCNHVPEAAASDKRDKTKLQATVSVKSPQPAT